MNLIRNNSYRMICFILFLFSELFLNSIVLSQSQDDEKFIKIIPGAEYKTNGLNEFFLGKHWRDLWNTKINAQVLNLEKFAGGLKPVKKGGGLQTKSLRLMGNDGNEYKFRSINKDPSRSLPVELRNSAYADLLQDQVSIGLPVSPLIVYPLMKETGILSIKPELAVMPDSKNLEIYRKDFGGELGIIEQNPRAGKKGINDFENSDKVVNGFEIFKKLYKDNDEKISQTDFLKARLMDIFIGDRDRHADQWQWAGYKDNGKRIWFPIPRDRDYAFGKYDGLFPWASGLLAHSLVGFNEDIPSILELTWSGRHLDRRFLNGIGKPVWDSVAVYVKSKLTDDVLLNAVKQMPPEMFAKEGMNLYNMLKSRRKQFLNASNEFYKLSSDVIDVYGSNKNEYAEIKVMNEDSLELKIFKRDKNTGDKKGNPFYERVFDNEHTDEIRLHLLEGDDSLNIHGRSDNDILLRVISGKGSDVLKNTSELDIQLYDSDKSTVIKSSENIYYNNDKFKLPDKEIEKYEPVIEDRYGFWAFTPIIDYNSDDGYILGGGPNFVKFGFRADPYLYYLQLTGAYSTYSKDYDVKFYSDFYKLIHNTRVQFFLSASQLDFNRYYGEGNETVRIDSLADKNFYKTNQQNIFIEPRFSFPVLKNTELNLTLTYRYSNVSPEDNSGFLVDEKNPYGTGKVAGISFMTGIKFDNREKSILPSKGLLAGLSVNYFPDMLDYKEDFVKLNGRFDAYFSLKSFTDFNFFIKTGGEVIFGEYPFFEGAAVGGKNNLRGYPRERFLGDAMVFGNGELRMKVASLNLLLPGRLGISVISDIGRVFVKNDDSKKWHSTYGGGVWLNVLNLVEMNFLTAVSPEVTKYYFTFNLGL